jgi:hypothetical protein
MHFISGRTWPPRGTRAFANSVQVTPGLHEFEDSSV